MNFETIPLGVLTVFLVLLVAVVSPFAIAGMLFGLAWVLEAFEKLWRRG